MPSADDIKRQQTLLATYRRTLGILLEQRAAHGAAYAPPATISGIIEARGQIARIKGVLRGWGVAMDDEPNDAEASVAEQLAQPGRPVGQTFNFHGPVSAGTIQYGGTQHIGEVNIDMGDEFNFQGANLSGSNNTFKSTLTNVNQFIGGLPTTDATTKQQIEQLLKQLGVELEKVPAGSEDDAAAVEQTAKDLLEKASKEKPNKAVVNISAKGLKEAAANIAAVLPAVLPIATKIVEHIQALIT